MSPKNIIALSLLMSGLSGATLLHAQEAASNQPKPPFAEGDGFTEKAQAQAPIVASEEIATVAELYAYEQRLRRVRSVDRIRDFKMLAQASDDCAKPRAHLKLALLVSGIEPKLTDYRRARELLKGCLDKAQGPILKGYIRSRLDILAGEEGGNKALAVVSRKLVEEQEENKVLKDRIKTLEAKIEALTDIEQSLQEREQPK